MSNTHVNDDSWNITLTNDKEYEIHNLSQNELKEVFQEEWTREFNGIFIARDVDCRGQLIVFFQGERAYVAYEDFERQQWKCSYDLNACNREDWDDLVRLTPEDTQEYSFRRCSLIPKGDALRIVECYLSSGEANELSLSDHTGKPVVVR